MFVAKAIGAPEVVNTKELDPRDAQFPNPTEQFIGLSENGNGYSLKVERANRTCVFAKNLQVIDTIAFPDHIELHSLRWDGNSVWFLLKERTGLGTRPAAIAYCDPETNENHFILFHVFIGSEANGRIFEIRGISNGRINVYYRLVNPTTKAIKYYDGVVKRSEMIEFSRLDFTQKYSKPSGWILDPTIPLKRN